VFRGVTDEEKAKADKTLRSNELRGTIWVVLKNWQILRPVRRLEPRRTSNYPATGGSTPVNRPIFANSLRLEYKSPFHAATSLAPM
jgi:hypothetical protein